ncbi:MAG TPA: TonB family protein [Opitutaceae bacterium]|nr:TonB family protein [Opitutaceae bacterium]
MHARAPAAFFLSLLLHGTVVIAIVVLAFIVQQHVPPPVQVFELVAGPPTDLTATAAPALGSPEGTVDVKIPEPPARVEPARVEEAPPAAEVTRPAARPEAKPVAPAKPAPKMSYDQFVKQHGRPSTAKSASTGAPRATPVPKINAKGIADGVLGGSASSKGGGGGRALTAAQRTELEGYIARLVMALRQSHEKPPGLSELLTADVEFLIAADGSISRVHVVRSSGNGAFDESCVEAFQRMGSIGPKPDGKNDTWVLTFRMKDE